MRTIALPDGSPGIGFDDLRFAPALGRLLAPAGRSGNLDLIDPHTSAVTAIGGFSHGTEFDRGHDFGVTSADEGPSVVFATDRTSRELVVVDPERRTIVGRAKLGGEPDYVRWVGATHEVWVTEPGAEAIEVFGFSENHAARRATIAVPGGPESLIVDAASGKAYTNLWKGHTQAIDVATRRVGAAWSNGCEGSRGIELDAKRGLVVVGCAEGAVTLLDAASGSVLSRVAVGAGVDIIAYDSGRGHVYAPGARAGSLAIVGVREKALALLASVPIPKGSHCAMTAADGRAVVCDPKGGDLIEIEDRF